MGNTTTYEVRTKYLIDDKASRPLGGIAQAAGRAAGQTDALTRALKYAGAAMLGGKLFSLGKSALIGFNSKLEQANISLAFQERLLNKGIGWTQARKKAGDYFGYYQQVAKASLGTTEDFLTMHQRIAGTAKQYGALTGEIKEMVKGSTIVSQILGEHPEMVALDIKQMLAGTVTARDRTAQMLLASQGIAAKKFNALSGDKRREVVLKALQDPAIKEASKDLEQSWSGVTSTLEDNLKIAAGKVGLPLFKRLTAEVKQWNDWIDKHPEKIERFAKSFGDALVKGFEAVKGVAAFIADNREVLLKVAEGMLALKALNWGAGQIAGLGGAFGGAGGALGKVANAIPLVGIAYLTAKAAEQFLGNKRKDEERAGYQQAGFAQLNRNYGSAVQRWGMHSPQALAAGRTMYDEATKLGFMDKQGNIQSDKLALEGYGMQDYRQNRSGGGKVVDAFQDIALGASGGGGMTYYLEAKQREVNIAEINLQLMQSLLAGQGEQIKSQLREEENMRWWQEFQQDLAGLKSDGEKRMKAPPTNVKVTIQSVNAADPDRFVHDFHRAIVKTARNPTQAKRAWAQMK